MEANPPPISGPLGPAPGQMASRPMASFTKPTRGPVTTPSKGFQAQPARKATSKAKSPISAKAKQLGKAGKDTKALARKAKALKSKKKGKK